eukprot:COSAG01_NODE_82_length_27810_cov_36.968352_22_plen_61_part_00
MQGAFDVRARCGRGGVAANRPGDIPGGEVPPNRHSEQREHAGSLCDTIVLLCHRALKTKV